jgi:hypothetical protein
MYSPSTEPRQKAYGQTVNRKNGKGANGQKPYNLFHLNALYDLQRKIYTDAIVQGRKQWNEHRAFVTMVDRDEALVPTIYIADRGYESYNNMAHVIEKGYSHATFRSVLSASSLPKIPMRFSLPICLKMSFPYPN